MLCVGCRDIVATYLTSEVLLDGLPAQVLLDAAECRECLPSCEGVALVDVLSVDSADGNGAVVVDFDFHNLTVFMYF